MYQHLVVAVVEKPMTFVVAEIVDSAQGFGSQMVVIGEQETGGE